MEAREHKVVQRSFATSRRVPLLEISDLTEAYKECSNSDVYVVEQIPNTSHSNKTFTHASGGGGRQLVSLIQFLQLTQLRKLAAL